MKYIALLRGINLGNTKKIPMADLKKAFEELEFTDVKTLLNSGNVVFSTNKKDVSILQKVISEKLEKTFGWAIEIIIRPQEEVKQLIDENPFKKIVITSETRLYVTFALDTPKSNLLIPYKSEEKDFHILRVSHHEICSMLILSPKKGTADLMTFIEKHFGKNVTTRNWNTVVKLAVL